MKLRYSCFTMIVFLLAFAAVVYSEDSSKNKSCKDHPKLSGPCFKVRGRMAFYNGSPSVRIWPVGTNRILGISEGLFYLEGYDNVPKELVNQITWDTVMFADFTVCPFTDDQPEKMRFICVECAENISIKQRE